jgi:hypothetical protein
MAYAQGRSQGLALPGLQSPSPVLLAQVPQLWHAEAQLVPYGISHKVGGDTPNTDAKMERCVAQIVAQGRDKVSAIKICKAAIEKSMLGGTSALRGH